MFTIPTASSQTLSGVPFDRAAPIAAECKALYDSYDKAGGVRDPSMCKAILQFGSVATATPAPPVSPSPCLLVIFWSSKLAIDADGCAADAKHLNGVGLDPADGQNDTSFHFPNGQPLSSERHPFLVLPGGDFRQETGLALGDVAVIVYRDHLTAAICGDIGPVHKIGEASIRVHEAFLPDAPDPCIRNPDGSCRRIHDVSIEQDVLTFAFPGSAFGAELNPDNAEILIKARAYDLFQKLQS